MTTIAGLNYLVQASESATLIHLKADKERVSEENQKNLDKIHLLERKLADLEEGRLI